ncbi:LysR family transcriptional regulator [Falsiroseomonas tokyonensis]|uniref:LysR family transcriptional regulator n=1 Tax=Falsiroseomonas tokyonensis TaxID=430521 RepID=A0ABV7BTR8_9PROT|nr:LysR family transcriptional regulator [Falsiroseomonas tokyonensis]MBU8538254.1 LysR family transcriptional regulator [Falsiroseomonas tokyonensis]
MRDFSWDDAKIFAAVVEAGGWRRAAQRLGLSAATTSRRVDAFEAWAGEKLLERRPDGLRLTPRGARVMAALQQMGQAADSIRRATAEREQEVVRISATASMALVLAEHMSALAAATPGVVISLLPSRAILSLARREAEIAIRMRTPPDSGSLVMRRLARVRVALYAAPSLVPDPAAADLRALPYIGLARPAAQSRTVRALEALVGLRPPVAVLDDTPIRLRACIQGLGMALLPCLPAEATGRLHRIASLPPDCDEDAWLVMHEDLAPLPALRAVAEAVAALFHRQRAALMGE